MEEIKVITVIPRERSDRVNLHQVYEVIHVSEGDCTTGIPFGPMPVCALARNDMCVKECVMYLSIGGDFAVRDTSIIGIFDLDNTTTSKRTREFLTRAEKEGAVVPCDDLPKSFLLTAEYGMERVYLTTLSAPTLEKRLERKK